jgi:hypothetical protein
VFICKNKTQHLTLEGSVSNNKTKSPTLIKISKNLLGLSFGFCVHKYICMVCNAKYTDIAYAHPYYY